MARDYEQKRGTAVAKDDEQHYFSNLSAGDAPVAIVWIDTTCRVVAHNDRAAEVLLPSASGECYFSSLVDESDRSAWFALAEDCRGTGADGVRDVRLSWLDGRRGLARVTARRVPDTPTLCVSVTDISDLKRTEDDLIAEARRNRALLRETNHRTKNLLTIIGSSIELKARTAETPEARHIAHALGTQVASLQRAVDALTRGDDISQMDAVELLGELVEYLAAGLRETVTITYETSVESLPLSAEATTSLSLAVAELCFNAAEHAFPDERSGTIQVSVARAGARTPGEAVVVVRDDGIGIGDIGAGQSANSLGLIIVTDMVEGHLRGTVEWNRREPGTEVRIEFPLRSR